MKYISVFVDACTVMNDMSAWYISGNRDASRCIDIDPDTLYELPYYKEQIQRQPSQILYFRAFKDMQTLTKR